MIDSLLKNIPSICDISSGNHCCQWGDPIESLDEDDLFFHLEILVIFLLAA